MLSNAFFSHKGAHATGSTESLVLPELTLVPLEQGRYQILFAGLDTQPRDLGGLQIPCLQLTVLHGPSQAEFDTGQVAWLTAPGQQVGMTVLSPRAIICFLTLRPGDYPQTGMQLKINRLPDDTAQPPFGQPQQAPRQQGAPGQPPFGQPAPQQPPFAQAGMGAQQVPGSQPGMVPPPWAAGQPQQQPPLAQPGMGGQHGMVPPPWAAGQPQQQPPFVQPAAPQQRPGAFGARQAAGLGLRLAGHIQNLGDQAAEPGQPVGVPGSGLRLEAVAMMPEGLDPQELEYAAITPDGRMSPWATAPNFCGTRGRGLHLIGFVARLTGAAAQRFDITYGGTFIQAGDVGEVRNGEFLQSPHNGDMLESLRVRVTPKGAL